MEGGKVEDGKVRKRNKAKEDEKNEQIKESEALRDLTGQRGNPRRHMKLQNVHRKTYFVYVGRKLTDGSLGECGSVLFVQCG